MNIFYQMGKRSALDLLKRADSVIVAKNDRRKLDRIFPKHTRSSVLTKEQAQSIYEAMAAASKYDALKHTNVHINGSELSDFLQRVEANPKIWNIGKAGIYDHPEARMLHGAPVGTMPDSFHPWSGDVYVPSANPGVLMHELGHAIDMQEFPHESYTRGFMGNAYRKLSPTLGKEHAAWNKGKNRFLEGAAKTDLDPALVTRTLSDAAQTKPVGLGSYWGVATGGALGLGAGVIANSFLPREFKIRGGLPFITAGIGAAIGGPVGMQIGKYIGSKENKRDSKAFERYKDEYAKAYSKEKGISLDEAKFKIRGKSPLAALAA